MSIGCKKYDYQLCSNCKYTLPDENKCLTRCVKDLKYLRTKTSWCEKWSVKRNIWSEM